MYSFFIGPFTTARRISEIFEVATPLIFTALSLIVMMRSNLFNFSADGAFFLGSLAASVVAVYLPMPRPLHIIVSLGAGAVSGMLVTVIPGIVKVKYKSSELVASFMMNYLVWNFVIWIVAYKIRDYSVGFTATKPFEETAVLTKLFDKGNIHTGLIIALLSVAAVQIYLNHTKQGYALRMTGENTQFAKFSGINTAKVMLISQIIGGAIAGLGGGAEVLGKYDRFRWGASPMYGFTGFTVVMLAKSNPAAVPLAALFYAYLETGAEIMGRQSDVAPEVIQVVQALIVVIVAGEAFLSKWRQKMIVKAAQNDDVISKNKEAAS